MKITDFNTNLMTTKVVFREESIATGSVIRVYKVKKDDICQDILKDKVMEPFATGIVVSVDNLMIKYGYYSVSRDKLVSAYLQSSDIFDPNKGQEQWGNKESLYIFKVEG